MFDWLTSFWGATLSTGPARNAPNEGVGIKTLLETRPAQVTVISSNEILSALHNLRKTVIQEKYVRPLPALLQEFCSVCEKGYRAHFAERRRQRNNRHTQKQIQSLEESYTNELISINPVS